MYIYKYIYITTIYRGFTRGSVVKNPPAMQEMQDMWV